MEIGEDLCIMRQHFHRKAVDFTISQHKRVTGFALFTVGRHPVLPSRWLEMEERPLLIGYTIKQSRDARRHNPIAE